MRKTRESCSRRSIRFRGHEYRHHRMSEELGSEELADNGTGERASVETVTQALGKVLASGMLHRIPRHPEHRNILLALLCLDLRRRYPYPEVEINRYLMAALETVRARVDHVTCRRYLVDLGFLRRDRAGIRYFLNFPKVESVLSDEAMTRAPDLVARAVAQGARRHKPRRGKSPRS